MRPLIEQFHDIGNEVNLKLAPEKSYFMLLSVENFDDGIIFSINGPVFSVLVAIHRFPFPTMKIELIRFIGAMNIYSKFFDKTSSYSEASV